MFEPLIIAICLLCASHISFRRRSYTGWRENILENKSSSAKKEIPVFFSTDDNYVPYLDVAISSLIANASDSYNYRIVVLNTGLLRENVNKVKKMEREGVRIDFVDISAEVENIRSHLKNVYHFSVVTYYRLFISSLFPEYDKIVYLDCDIVVLGDISELYNTELGDNIIAAVPDQYVPITEEFKIYTEKVVGVDSSTYINAGVLVINLNEFRKNQIEEQFVNLITEYNFDVIDPDQAYINYLCYGKIHILPNRWNKQPLPTPCEGKKSIVHYALYKKPWQYDDVIDGDCFWQYAKSSPFYGQILEAKQNFGDEDKARKDAAAGEILAHATSLLTSDNTFKNRLCVK